jgi:hypothetical protein
MLPMLSSQSIHKLLYSYLRTNEDPFFDIWSGNVWTFLMQIPKLSLFLFMTFTEVHHSKPDVKRR